MYLGLALANGKHGLTVDQALAARWLEKSLEDDCVGELSPALKAKAMKRLAELNDRAMNETLNKLNEINRIAAAHLRSLNDSP